MEQKTNQLIRTIYAYALGACLVVTAAIFIYLATDIYFGATGGDIYTPVIVSARFSRVAWFVYFTLAAIVGGGVIAVLFPPSPEKLYAKTEPKTLYARLSSRYIAAGGSETDQLLSLRRARKILTAVCSILLSLCAVVAFALVVAAKTEGKGENAAACSVLPSTLVALAVATLYVYANRALLLKEIDCLKQAFSALKDKKVAPGQMAAAGELSTKTVLISRISLLAVGAMLTVFGAIDGGAYDTFVKAVQICTQCIGLG